MIGRVPTCTRFTYTVSTKRDYERSSGRTTRDYDLCVWRNRDLYKGIFDPEMGFSGRATRLCRSAAILGVSICRTLSISFYPHRQVFHSFVLLTSRGVDRLRPYRAFLMPRSRAKSKQRSPKSSRVLRDGVGDFVEVDESGRAVATRQFSGYSSVRSVFSDALGLVAIA